MASSKTKAVVALGVLDIVRQATHAWSARREAERDRTGFGEGVRADAARIAHDVRQRLPERLEWGMPPWRYGPTATERIRTWLPVVVVMMLSTLAVVVAARAVSRQTPDDHPDELVTDSRMLGAVRAGSSAIDAGVEKVTDGAGAAATGAVSGIAAGGAAAKQATIHRAKQELDERVVRPAKHKLVVYGGLGLVALTVYVVIVAAIVQLVVAAYA